MNDIDAQFHSSHKQNTYKTCVLFGGTGFIGRHFGEHLLAARLCDSIYLCDISPPDPTLVSENLKKAIEDNRARYLPIDVREPIEHSGLPRAVDLTVNLAAVHREPGHLPAEYYDTNVSGARNVCEWATKVGCRTIVFTSSIAPYGPSETEKDEHSPPAPASPYGISKLEAERIHLRWQSKVEERRRLLVVRPGVVFGPGEGGNVSRMIRAILGRYFFYMGNRETRKAGGYVKELCYTMTWALERQQTRSPGVELYNFTMSPAPSMEEYVNAICRVAGISRIIPRVPYPLALLAATILDVACLPFNLDNPFSPVRIRKLVRSNNIVPGHLRREGYGFRFTLEQAMADWRRERPDEWGK